MAAYTMVVENRKKKTLRAEVEKHIEAGAALYSDDLPRMPDSPGSTRTK
jgi:hypothetical protein